MNRTPRQDRRQHRGFCMILAVLLLALVGVAIATLTNSMAQDGCRTVDRQRNAQLEQILIAAADDATMHLAANPAKDQSIKVQLPVWLADEGAAVKTTVQASQADQVTLLIRATVNRRAAEQTVQLHRDAGKWRIVAMQLAGS